MLVREEKLGLFRDCCSYDYHIHKIHKIFQLHTLDKISNATVIKFKLFQQRYQLSNASFVSV